MSRRVCRPGLGLKVVQPLHKSPLGVWVPKLLAVEQPFGTSAWQLASPQEAQPQAHWPVIVVLSKVLKVSDDPRLRHPFDQITRDSYEVNTRRAQSTFEGDVGPVVIFVEGRRESDVEVGAKRSERCINLRSLGRSKSWSNKLRLLAARPGVRVCQHDQGRPVLKLEDGLLELVPELANSLNGLLRSFVFAGPRVRSVDDNEVQLDERAPQCHIHSVLL